MSISRFAALAVLAVPVAALAADMPTPGMWAVKGQVTNVELGAALPAGMKDMIKKQMMSQPAQDHKQCITKEDFENAPEKLVKSTESNCQYESFDISGGKMNAIAVCAFPQGGKGRMEMTGTYTATSFTSQSKVVVDSQMGQMVIESEGTGTRTGDC